MVIEVPHFAALRGGEREVVVLRSDSGDIWREHTLQATEEAVHEALNGSFNGTVPLSLFLCYCFFVTVLNLF